MAESMARIQCRRPVLMVLMGLMVNPGHRD